MKIVDLTAETIDDSISLGYAAWLKVLVGAISLGMAAVILQLFARSRGDRYDFGSSLRLVSGLIAGAVGLLFITRPKVRSEAKSRQDTKPRRLPKRLPRMPLQLPRPEYAPRNTS